MEVLFDGIPLDQVSTSMTINGPAVILFCFYVAAAERTVSRVGQDRTACFIGRLSCAGDTAGALPMSQLDFVVWR